MRGEMRDEDYVSISVLMENTLCPARIICRGKKQPEGSNQGFLIIVPLSLSKPLQQGLQHRLHGHSSSLQSLPLELQNSSNSGWLHSMGPLLLTLLPHLVPRGPEYCQPAPTSCYCFSGLVRPVFLCPFSSC